MATGDNSNVLVLAVLQSGGKVGAIGLMVSSLGQLIVSMGVLSPSWFPFFASIQALGLSVAVVSIAFHSKRSSEMQATVAAENKIQNPHYTPESADPLVQQEIDKILVDPVQVSHLTGPLSTKL
jgi:hypothetical protein